MLSEGQGLKKKKILKHLKVLGFTYWEKITGFRYVNFAISNSPGSNKPSERNDLITESPPLLMVNWPMLCMTGEFKYPFIL